MSAKVLATAAIFSASLFVTACGGDDHRTLDDPLARDVPATDTARTTPAETEVVEASVTGQIDNVDLESGSLTVMSGGMEHRFVFTEDTEVVGAAGTQGLASNEGDWVTVYFQDMPDSRRALRIELDPAR